MRYRIVFWVFLGLLLPFAGIEIYIVISGTAERSNIASLIFISVGIVALLYAIIKNSNRYEYTIYLLYYTCNPEAYIIQIEQMLDAEILKKHPRQLGKLILCLCDGLTAAGRYQESLDNLPEVDFFSRGKSSQLNLVWYHHCRCSNYLYLGYPDMAEISLSNMKQALDDLTPGEGKKRFQQRYAENAALLDIARGHYDAAEPVFLSSFQNARHNFGRSAAKFALGEIYRHTNRIDEAAKACQYVIEYGYKLHIADLAASLHPALAR